MEHLYLAGVPCIPGVRYGQRIQGFACRRSIRLAIGFHASRLHRSKPTLAGGNRGRQGENRCIPRDELTFIRCMMVHSVSTREVGSLPPSLSNVCMQDIIHRLHHFITRTMLAGGVKYARRSTQQRVFLHLLKLFERSFVLRKFHYELCQRFLRYTQMIFKLCTRH